LSAVPGVQSVIDGGLGLERGALPGLAGGTAHPPFGALDAAGGSGQRERALGGALPSARRLKITKAEADDPA